LNPKHFFDLIGGLQPIPRDSNELSGMVAMLLYITEGAKEKPFVNGTSTW